MWDQVKELPQARDPYEGQGPSQGEFFPPPTTSPQALLRVQSELR